jgi:hypothetical protein
MDINVNILIVDWFSIDGQFVYSNNLNKIKKI